MESKGSCYFFVDAQKQHVVCTNVNIRHKLPSLSPAGVSNVSCGGSNRICCFIRRFYTVSRFPFGHFVSGNESRALIRFAVGAIGLAIAVSILLGILWIAQSTPPEVNTEHLISDELTEPLARKRYMQAKAQLEAGDHESALDDLHRLAHQPEPYVPAAKLLVTWIAEENLYEQFPNYRDRVVDYLQILAESGDEEAIIVLAEQYAGRGEPRMAIQELFRVVDNRPEYNLTLAQLLDSLGETEKLKPIAGRAEEHFRSRLNEQDVASAQALDVRLLAISLELQGKRKEAILVLSEYQPTHSGLTEQLMELLLLDAELLKVQKPSIAFKRLNQAVSLAPDSVSNWERMYELSVSESSIADTVRETISAARQSKRSGPAIALLTALKSYERGAHKVAVKHARSAVSESESGSKLWLRAKKELAKILANGDSSDGQQALAIAREITKLDKDDRSAKEVLGYVLGKLGQFEEAEETLEEVVGDPEVGRFAIEALAEVYQKQGKLVERGVLLSSNPSDESAEPPQRTEWLKSVLTNP